jgi:hypothetical protein
VTASLKTNEPLDIWFESTDFRILENAEEVTAALALAGATEPFDAYHRPEPSKHTKHTVDAEGNVYGHLAAWGKCHDGIKGRCVLAPKPAHYGDFHQGSVLTERGLVDTGVLFFLGGHPDKPLGKSDAGVENTWAKVRVVNGRLGPWYCGRVISGLSPEALELARATPVSGHWRDDQTLAAIISVNVRGNNIPGTDRTFDTDGVSFDSEGRRHDLVASLRVADEDKPDRPSAEEFFQALGGIKRFSSMTPIVQGINTTGNIQYSTTSSDTMAGELEIAEALADAVDEACGVPDHQDALERMALLVEVEIELAD